MKVGRSICQSPARVATDSRDCRLQAHYCLESAVGYDVTSLMRQIAGPNALRVRGKSLLVGER